METVCPNQLIFESLSKEVVADFAGSNSASSTAMTKSTCIIRSWSLTAGTAFLFVLNPQTPQLWAFTGEVGRTYALYLFDTRTRKRTRLTQPDMIASHPCWSLDGQYPYFIGSGGLFTRSASTPRGFTASIVTVLV